MNPEDEKWLQEVRARLEKATPGTWEHCRGKLRPQFGTRINEVRSNGDSCAVVAWPGFDDSARDEKEHAANAKLIAHAPKDLRADYVLSWVRQLAKEHIALRS